MSLQIEHRPLTVKRALAEWDAAMRKCDDDPNSDPDLWEAAKQAADAVLGAYREAKKRRRARAAFKKANAA